MRMNKKHRILDLFRNNDIIFKMYMSFAFVLALTGILTGLIFIQLYQRNYIDSYQDILMRQGEKISKRVSSLKKHNMPSSFQKYCRYIEELEEAEQTDVWILSNDNAKRPLGEDFTNAESDDGILSDEMYEVLEKAYNGESASNNNYDKVYGMVILRVTQPIEDEDSGEIIGAVMMVSMLDRQSMGVAEGKYLIMISVLLSFVISYLVAFVFAQYLSKPLTKIERNISRIADGNYADAIIRKPNSQLGRLEVKLNVLARRLDEAGKERDNLEKLRQDFFANVSHELRTPITVLRGYAETLSDGIITDENGVVVMYQRLLSECQSMERLVGDLFILSKMQNPDFEIETEPVSLIQIFGDVTRSARVIASEKDIHLKEDFPENDPCMMLGDYVRLRQMFMVIIDNAVKFSETGGIVELHIEKKPEPHILNVYIRDYGVGISKDELPYIFEKFYKSKLRQNASGTGLGLMIAKQIAVRHGGTLTVESEDGKGTTFSFSFEECISVEEYE